MYISMIGRRQIVPKINVRTRLALDDCVFAGRFARLDGRSALSRANRSTFNR
jgi:hypothetical protein